MSKTTAITIEVYKKDKRIKRDERYGRNKVGLRFVEVIDFESTTDGAIDKVVAEKQKQGFVTQVFETYVTRKNLLSGQDYQERYDTPRFCSPSSETYWSM